MIIIGKRKGVPEPTEFLNEPDYAGRHYDRFFVSRDHVGPGWYIFGRNPEYGNHLICLVARPNVPPRKHSHYNVRVRRGFRLKRDAESVAAYLNTRFPNGTKGE